MPKTFTWLKATDGIRKFDFADPDVSWLSAEEHVSRVASVTRWSHLKDATPIQEEPPVYLSSHVLAVSEFCRWYLKSTTSHEVDPADYLLVCLAALHHDDHEALPPFDLAAPFKRFLASEKLDILADNIDTQIWAYTYNYSERTIEVFRSSAVQAVVAKADWWIAAIEAMQYFDECPYIRPIEHERADVCLDDVMRDFNFSGPEESRFRDFYSEYKSGTSKASWAVRASEGIKWALKPGRSHAQRCVTLQNARQCLTLDILSKGGKAP